MQADQLRQRLMQVDESINQASRACQSASNAPEILRNCLNELDQESDQAKQAMEQSGSEAQVRDCVDRMEDLGDQAVKACSQSNGIDPQLKSTVQQAHDAISDLKHQLH
jgi:hypothetical protein